MKRLILLVFTFSAILIASSCGNREAKKSSDTSIATEVSRTGEASSENWNDALNTYEEYVDKYIDLMKMGKNGDASAISVYLSGEKGIRTPGTASSTPDFESGPFDHSGISPGTKLVISNNSKLNILLFL